MENPTRPKALKLLVSCLHMNTHCQSGIWLSSCFHLTAKCPLHVLYACFFSCFCSLGKVLEALRNGGYLEKEGHWEVDIDGTTL